MNHSRILRALADNGAEWMRQASCRSMDPNVFHRPKGDTEGVRRAIAICHDCPTREPCLERALQLGVSAQGIWAGTSERERERLRQRRRADVS